VSEGTQVFEAYTCVSMVSCLRWNSSSLRCRSDSSAAHLHPPQSTAHITVVSERKSISNITAIGQTTEWCLNASAMSNADHVPRYVPPPFGETRAFLCQPFPHGIALGRELLLHCLSCPNTQNVTETGEKQDALVLLVQTSHAHKLPSAPSVSTALPDACHIKKCVGWLK
jgi:hypothetical protein